MVKLATAREARLYGPALAVRRWEYINAGLYAFAALLLAADLAALSAGGGGARAGLAVAAVVLALVAAVNAHDLAAHLAGVDWRVGLARYDVQLGLVELLVPALHAVGCVLGVAGMALLLSQGEGRGYSYGKEKHAGTHAARRGTALASGVGAQLVPGLRARRWPGAAAAGERAGAAAPGEHPLPRRRRVQEPVLVGRRWVWLCLIGSALWLVAALFNVLKVFMMHQSDALRLEKLRGGAQERLSRDREGRVPLNWEEVARRRELHTELR